MPRQEGHPAAGYLADEHCLTRLAVRGLDLHLVGVGQKLVETRTPDDPDVGDRGHDRQATFSPEEPEELPEEEEPEEPEEEEDEADDDDEDEDFSPAFLSPLSPSPVFLSPAELGESPDDEDAAAAADDPLR
ncbi:MAG: hypothetical protein WB688_15010, partial [Trebonia sp.]